MNLMQTPIPDAVFYYTLSLLLSVALIGIIWRFAERVSATLNELRHVSDELKVLMEVHKNVAEEHNSRLTRLEDAIFIVKYPEKE